MSKSKAREFDADFIDFVSLCNKHEVNFLVIGGFAVSVHGYPRYTKDLDICIQLSDTNAEKIVEVINEFGFASLQLEKADFLKPNFVTQLGHEPLRIDILNDIDGVSFDVAWKNRKIVNYLGVEIPFIGYNELLIIKKIAGRPQDLADIDKLEKRKKKK